MKKNTIKKTICAALAAIMTVSAAGCGSTGSSSENGNVSTQKTVKASNAQPVSEAQMTKKGKAPAEGFNKGYTDFSAELFKASCLEDIKSGKNTLVSPESVACALGMAANGAGGQTLAEMENVLGSNLGDLNDSLNYYICKANGDKNIKFNIADSLWVRDDADRIKLLPEFADTVKEYYGADSYLEPFDDSTLDNINNWVNNNTAGMIPALIDDIPDSACAYLINAAAFDAKWEEEFEDDQVLENKIFTSCDGIEQDCTMLLSYEYTYLSDGSCKGFAKYYKGGDYCFMALLPNGDMVDFVQSLDGDKLASLWQNRSSDEVVIKMPEFTYDYNVEMAAPLADMGMPTAFGDGCDFSKMSTPAKQIDRVIHKTHIEVDRKGTKAAAATALEAVDGCIEMPTQPKYVTLDRPFVYAIVDADNGVPLFIGAVNSVK